MFSSSSPFDIALNAVLDLGLMVQAEVTLWESVLEAPPAKTFAFEGIVSCDLAHAAAFSCRGESSEAVTRQV